MDISVIKLIAYKSEPSAQSFSFFSFPSSTKTRLAGVPLSLPILGILLQYTWCPSEVSCTLSLLSLWTMMAQWLLGNIIYGERTWKVHWCNGFKTFSLLYRVLEVLKVEILTESQSQWKREIVETRKLWRRLFKHGQLRQFLGHSLWVWIVQNL